MEMSFLFAMLILNLAISMDKTIDNKLIYVSKNDELPPQQIVENFNNGTQV